MHLYIRNMVCNRCIMAVKSELEKLGYIPLDVQLGEVELKEDISGDELKVFKNRLDELGFELIDDSKSKLIEKIKLLVIQLIHHGDGQMHQNYSQYITSKLNKDYNYLSHLFSEVEGTTIEKYIINQKIERVKELLVYNELTLSEIADSLEYSSVAHLSGQFRKVTGLTPSYFKKLKENKRKPLDEV
jgi:AraC-like DNA-binding protein/copper chaperone CopZ